MSKPLERPFARRRQKIYSVEKISAENLFGVAQRQKTFESRQVIRAVDALARVFSGRARHAQRQCRATSR
jgi:hypothetical protein